MGNLEFQQPETGGEKQEQNEQIDYESMIGYNRLKDEIKKLNDMRRSNTDDVDVFEDVQKAGIDGLSQITTKLSEAYGLGPLPHGPILQVNNTGEIEVNYKTNEKTSESKNTYDRVKIVITETGAVKTTKSFVEYPGYPENNVGNTKNESFSLKKPNFRKDETKAYIGYADRLKEKAIAHMSSVDGDDLEILRRRLEEAYNQ